MTSPDKNGADPTGTRRRTFVAFVSLTAGLVILVAKFVAWRMTGSKAVLSDALESIVNVAAAAFALTAIRVAARPPDRDHPYGHGKMELLAAAFEGGLIAFAAGLIVYEAAASLVSGAELRRVDLGLAVTLAAGLGNLGVGAFVLRAGRKAGSPTLIADGKHILSDVWTTAGVVVGLLLVRLTGLVWFDAAAALVVGILLARTGVVLVRESADALMDKGDPDLLRRLVDAFNAAAIPGVAGLHRLRVLRHGDSLHIDGHVFVPHHWTVSEAHDATARLERALREETGLQAELALHVDPAAANDASLEPPRPQGGLTVEEAIGPPPRPRRAADREPGGRRP